MHYILPRLLCSEEIAELLRGAQEGTVRLLMSWVNVGEVAYIVERRWGRGRLYQTLGTLEATKIEFVPIGRELALAAAHIKAEHPPAYANALAAALAAKENAILVTGDPEFKALAKSVSICWIPREA